MKAIVSASLLLAGAAIAIEKPDYDVVEKDGKLELRRYEELPVASAPMAGMKQRNDSFGRLFRFISGENAAEQKIEMTSPVFMEGSAKDVAPAGSGTMSFLVPAAVAKAGTPEPTGEEVRLRAIPGGTVATIRFKGWKSEKDRQSAVTSLQEWIDRKGWKATGKPLFAIYNPPWTPSFLRRNEVWIHVEAPEEEK